MQNIPQFQGVIFRTGSMGTKYVARYTNQTFKQVMSRHTYTSKCITWYNERSKIIKEKFIKMSLSMRPLEASELGQCLVKWLSWGENKMNVYQKPEIQHLKDVFLWHHHSPLRFLLLIQKSLMDLTISVPCDILYYVSYKNIPCCFFLL